MTGPIIYGSSFYREGRRSLDRWLFGGFKPQSRTLVVKLPTSGLYVHVTCRHLSLSSSAGPSGQYQRVVFPLHRDERIVNLYGRSIGSGFAHRFLTGT